MREGSCDMNPPARAVPEEARPAGRGGTPSDGPIIVALGDAEEGWDLLPVVRSLAAVSGSRVLLVRVHEPIPSRWGGFGIVDAWRSIAAAAVLRRAAEDELRSVASRFALLLGSDRTTSALLEGESGEELASYAEARRAAMVVMGVRPGGLLGRAGSGGAAETVLRRSGRPVLLVPRGTGAVERIERVLVLLDGSVPQDDWVERVLSVCGREGVRYTLLRVVAPGASTEGAAEAPARLREWAAGLSARGYEVETWVVGSLRPLASVGQVGEAIGADLVARAHRAGNEDPDASGGIGLRRMMRRVRVPILVA